MGDRLAGVDNFAAWADRVALRAAWGVALVNVLFPLLLLAGAVLEGRDFYRVIDGERNAMTWFSSLQLMLIALVAALNTGPSRLRGGVRRHAWVWPLTAAGFVFLALDERFEFHETLRNEVLRPADLFADILWIDTGDVVLFGYLAAGLVLAYFLFRELAPVARWLFAAALALTAAVFVLDSLPREMTRDVRALTTIVEELGETAGQLLFLLAFLLTWRFNVSALAGKPQGDVR